MRHSVTSTGLVILVLALAGCHLLRSEPIRLDIDARTFPEDRLTSVLRVLVLPFSNDTAFESQGKVVEEAFAQELAQRGYFEVIRIPDEDTDLFVALEPYTTGRIPLDLLIELGEYYRTDAVLLGCLKNYDPYIRPKIGLKADLVAVRDGSVLRSVHGLLDSGEEMVTRDVKAYYENQLSQECSLYEWRRVTASPETFARYACNRFVNALYSDSSGGEAK